MNQKKFNKFKHALACIVALNDHIIFAENIIGYHIWG
jgi:hypothetical protein